LKNKHDLQIPRLAIREQSIATHADLARLVAVIHRRYNLIQERAELFALLQQTLSCDVVLDQIIDEYLLDEISL
jgi:hypothetical protein